MGEGEEEEEVRVGLRRDGLKVGSMNTIKPVVALASAALYYRIRIVTGYILPGKIYSSTGYLLLYTVPLYNSATV